MATKATTEKPPKKPAKSKKAAAAEGSETLGQAQSTILSLLIGPCAERGMTLSEAANALSAFSDDPSSVLASLEANGHVIRYGEGHYYVAKDDQGAPCFQSGQPPAGSTDQAHTGTAPAAPQETQMHPPQNGPPPGQYQQQGGPPPQQQQQQQHAPLPSSGTGERGFEVALGRLEAMLVLGQLLVGKLEALINGESTSGVSAGIAHANLDALGPQSSLGPPPAAGPNGVPPPSPVNPVPPQQGFNGGPPPGYPGGPPPGQQQWANAPAPSPAPQPQNGYDQPPQQQWQQPPAGPPPGPPPGYPQGYPGQQPYPPQGPPPGYPQQQGGPPGYPPPGGYGGGGGPPGQGGWQQPPAGPPPGPPPGYPQQGPPPGGPQRW